MNATFSFDHIQIDLTGKMISTNERNNYVLLVVDVATCFLILQPLQTLDSLTVTKELINVFCNFGFLKIVQSNNRSEFSATLQA
jgi:hypothetical protein